LKLETGFVFEDQVERAHGLSPCGPSCGKSAEERAE